MLVSEDNLEIFESLLPSAYKQGDIGEVITAMELRELGFKVLRNLYLPYNSKFTEVDILGITPFGLFIIENKNYKGVVSGSISDKYWKVTYSLFHDELLFNPIIQNNLHKDVILDYINKNFDLDERYVFRPVIFNDKCSLNIKGSEKDVFTLSQFKDVYLSYAENAKEVISSDCQLKLYEFFSKFSNITDLMRLLHLVLMKG